MNSLASKHGELTMKSESHPLLRPIVAIGLGFVCLLHAACFPARESTQPAVKLAVAPATQPVT